MFGRKPKIEDLKLAQEIDSVLNSMAEYGPDSPEYPKLIKQLKKLNELKMQKRRMVVSPDTMLIVGGNLLGILIIVAYEQRHVMTSKGLSFVNLKTK